MNPHTILKEEKEKILIQFYDWVETFNPENILYNSYSINEEEEDEMYASYEYLLNLADRYDKGNCTEKDYEKILFHIEQIKLQNNY